MGYIVVTPKKSHPWKGTTVTGKIRYQARWKLDGIEYVMPMRKTRKSAEEDLPIGNEPESDARVEEVIV